VTRIIDLVRRFRPAVYRGGFSGARYRHGRRKFHPDRATGREIARPRMRLPSSRSIFAALSGEDQGVAAREVAAVFGGKVL